MSLRNRLVMSSMETMYGTLDGLPSERTRDYFAARAKGGVGLITVGATGIDHRHPGRTSWDRRCDGVTSIGPMRLIPSRTSPADRRPK